MNDAQRPFCDVFVYPVYRLFLLAESATERLQCSVRVVDKTLGGVGKHRLLPRSPPPTRQRLLTHQTLPGWGLPTRQECTELYRGTVHALLKGSTRGSSSLKQDGHREPGRMMTLSVRVLS